MSLAWYDGKFVEKNSITVSPNDFGFSRGVALYEFCRVYGGIPFHLEDHIERLEHGVAELGIAWMWKRADIVAIVERICAENRYAHSTIKFYLTIGECGSPGAGGFPSCADFTPHLMIMEDEAHPKHPEAPRGLDIYQRGIALKTVPFSRQMPTVKSINYAVGFAAAREWGKQGYDDILFTHAEGFVTETTMGNFFAVIDGVLCTPKREMLFGVTRKVLLELAPKAGIQVAARDIGFSELARVTEAFNTGSYAEMLPVRKIDDHILPLTTDGPVFKKLRRAFTDYVAEVSRPGAGSAATHRASA